MMWEEQYLKHTQAARVFSLERDAIGGRVTIAGEKYDTRRADDVEIDYTNGIHEDVLEENEDFAQLPFCEDSPKLATIRTKAYKEAWEACQADIRTVLQDLYNETIGQLRTFVRSAPTRSRYAQKALSTGVILGANQTLSSALTDALQKPSSDSNLDEPGPSSRPARPQKILVARISSRTCTNKRLALKSVIQAVIAADQCNEGSESTRRVPGKKLSMAATDDMETLVTWYKTRFSQEDAGPRIAVYFEELESFESAILTDLLEILSAYSGRLPMVLLLAVSTSISAIHTLLPRATSELLRVVPFTVTPNIETFHSLIYETFIKRQQVLAPSSKVFGFLRDTFLDLNQSIDGVIAKLQYMYLAHYFGNPASVLCNPLPDHPDFEDQLKVLGNITPTLRSFPSAQKRIERHTEEALAKKNDILLRMTRQLLESDEELLRAVNAARRERGMYAADLPQAWALFEILQSTWAEGRISMETMLTEYFSGTMLKRTSTACRNLRNARDDVVMTFLRNANEAVDLDGNGPCNLLESLQRLKQLLEEGTRQTGLTRLVNGNIQGSIAKSEGDKLFTAFVKELSDRLEIYFKEHLKPFTELIFHEIWYPEVHRVMRSAFHPHILDQIQTSLISPSSRLPLHLFDDSDTLPTAENLDVCRSYKLVAEAGKLVNLADWYGAFEVSLEDDYDADKAEEGAPEDSRSSKRHKGPAKRSSSRRSGKSRSDEPNGYSNGNAEANDGMDTEESEDEDLARMRTHQARFLASAADLAYLGFIQPTKRKAEHVARIVF